jgi:hypothetical protein
VRRLTVKPGLKNTGELFLCPPATPSQKTTQIIGVNSAEKAVYRYDLANDTLVQWEPTPAALNGTIQKPDDGSLWSIMDGMLVRTDPFTLKMKVLGKLQSTVTRMVWLNNQLYAAAGGGSGYLAGSELHKVEKE